MSFENFPPIEPLPPIEQPKPPSNKWQKYLIGLLVLILLGTWSFIIWYMNKNKDVVQQKDTIIATTSSEKDQLQKELEDATMRYDDIKTKSANMAHSKDSVITSRDKDIAAKREKIRQLLANANATKEELAQAKTLIASLNDDIENYKTKIEKLEGEKIVLTQEKEAVTRERDIVTQNLDSAKTVIKQKDDVIDIGSTLHASNFNVVGINEKGNGKEKVTTTAKRVAKLRISFDLDENRIVQTGTKDIYVCITGPDGVAIGGGGSFNTRDGAEKVFTQKLQVNYIQGQRQTLSFDWKKDGAFKTGDYRIEIYNNGFKIGEGVRPFKKGGLFN